jgi:hypothetical protein
MKKLESPIVFACLTAAVCLLQQGALAQAKQEARRSRAVAFYSPVFVLREAGLEG